MDRKEYLEKFRRRRRQMQKMRDEGLTLAEIAAHFGVSYQAVQSALKNGTPAAAK